MSVDDVVPVLGQGAVSCASISAMNDTYNVLDHQGEGKVTEKMSRFLAFARYVETEEEARAVVKDFQNEYHDARHVCWAFMVGPNRDKWQLNDNGEPSGTAGKPILGQINSLGLTNVVVVVVRYFGGIKLGTSGLIAAYRQAARLALEDGDSVVMRRMKTVAITFPYMSMNDVMKLVKGQGLRIAEQVFDNTCEMTIEMPEDDYDAVCTRLYGIDGVSVQ